MSFIDTMRDAIIMRMFPPFIYWTLEILFYSHLKEIGRNKIKVKKKT